MHWKHSKFEIAYIILGNCHTYVEAYRVLSELEEDRNFSIESSLAESLRAQSKVVSSKLVLGDPEETKSGKLLAQCNLDEQAARKKIAQPCLDEARKELDFIRMLKSKIYPMCGFVNDNFSEAYQNIQALEWKLDLHWKTYSYMCTMGNVPYDHIMQLKMHPEREDLMSGLVKLRNAMQDNSEAVLYYSKTQVLQLVQERCDKVVLDPIKTFPSIEHNPQA